MFSTSAQVIIFQSFPSNSRPAQVTGADRNSGKDFGTAIVKANWTKCQATTIQVQLMK